MKAIVVMFDSLNRHLLQPYGCDWTLTPNFQRLAARTAVFDRAYVGSMPCMPARRELHTGRYNFLHRSWGPLEPFDESMPQLLKEHGIHTHLATDHQHYWEDGGATYHNRYSTYEFFRGQEGDAWKARLKDDFRIEPTLNNRSGAWFRQDWVNRSYLGDEAAMPQAQTFAAGLHFLDANHDADNWFLQIETFDPHEPFFAPEAYRQLYPHDWRGPHFDWPSYGPVTEEPEAVEHMRREYAALMSMCDAYLGKVLDAMDRYGLWDDTLLIVNTDHGFLLGEHDHWAKCAMPFWDEVAHTPLFIWDPRSRVAGERRQALVQTIDLPATLLEYFGVPLPDTMQGQPLRQTVADDTPVREAALFGLHGGHLNITDGRYVYMRAPVSADNAPLYNYTLMPTHMRSRFNVNELTELELAAPFSFTKGCRTLKVRSGRRPHHMTDLLYDNANDPGQTTPLDDPATVERLCRLMAELMAANDAPPEQYVRLGLNPPQGD